MKKITLYGSKETTTKASAGNERLTIQFRKYDHAGKYDSSGETNNATIHLKDLDINIAYEIVKNALLNSPYISKKFEVGDE